MLKSSQTKWTLTSSWSEVPIFLTLTVVENVSPALKSSSSNSTDSTIKSSDSTATYTLSPT